MAITATQRTQIEALTVGMFGAAPGADYLSQFSNYISGGGTMLGLANAFAGTALFQSAPFYPSFLTANEFANKFLTGSTAGQPAGGQITGGLLSGGTIAASDLAWAVNWVAGQLTAGTPVGQVCYNAITALDGVGSPSGGYSNAAFASVAEAFDNRVAVADYFSVTLGITSTSVSTLQDAVKGVTDDPQTVIDKEAALASGPFANGGQTFILTDASETITGTPGNDLFIGRVNDGSVTSPTTLQSVSDVLDGGAGVNRLQVIVEEQDTSYIIPNAKNFQALIVNDQYESTWDLHLMPQLKSITENGSHYGTDFQFAQNLPTDINIVNTINTSFEYLTVEADPTVAGGDVNVNLTNTGLFGGGWYLEVYNQNTGDGLIENVAITSTGNNQNFYINDSENLVTATITSGELDATSKAAGKMYFDLQDYSSFTTLDASKYDGQLQAYVESYDNAVTILVGNGGQYDPNVGDNSAGYIDVNGDLSQTITTGNGNYYLYSEVYGSKETSSITTGNGDNVIYQISEAGNGVITVGDGANTIQSDVAGTGTLTAGNGANVIDLSGYGTGTWAVTAGNGGNEIHLDSSIKTYTVTTGTGADTITIDALVLGDSVDGGGGRDTIVMTSAMAAAYDGKAGTVSNFEILGVSDQLVNDIDLSKFAGNSLDSVVLQSGFADGHTISNIGANSSVTLEAASLGNTLTATLKDASGTADVLNINLNNDTSTDFGTVSTSGVETVNITADDTYTKDKVSDTATFALNDTALKTVNIGGDFATVALTITDLSVTTVVNAGSLAGGLNTDLSAAAKALTVTGGSGADTLTLGDVKGNTVTTGAGNDTVTVGNGGSNTISTGTGNDTVTIGTGGGNTVDLGAGNDTLTLGNTINNTITLGGGTDAVTVTGVPTNGNSYSTITDFIKGDSLTDASITAFTTAKVSLAATAVFQDYLDAVVAGAAVGGSGWFQWNGDTYLVADLGGDSATFTNAEDFVIKLTGLIDLSKATFAAGTLTGG